MKGVINLRKDRRRPRDRRKISTFQRQSPVAIRGGQTPSQTSGGQFIERYFPRRR